MNTWKRKKGLSRIWKHPMKICSSGVCHSFEIPYLILLFLQKFCGLGKKMDLSSYIRVGKIIRGPVLAGPTRSGRGILSLTGDRRQKPERFPGYPSGSGRGRREYLHPGPDPTPIYLWSPLYIYISHVVSLTLSLSLCLACSPRLVVSLSLYFGKWIPTRTRFPDGDGVKSPYPASVANPILYMCNIKNVTILQFLRSVIFFLKYFQHN